MPKLIFIIGVPATGKTFFIDQNFRDKDAEILDVLDYQQRAYKAVDSREKNFRTRCLMAANDNLLSDIIERLLQNRNLVVEHTLYKAKRRIGYIDAIREAVPDVRIEMYVMHPSDSLWQSNMQKRNMEASFQDYKEEAAEMEFPNVAEGIDAIFEVADGTVIPRNDPPRPEILEPAREELRQEAERIQKEDEQRAFIKSMYERPFWHYCEVCGKKEYITAEEAFNKGWAYPPKTCSFGRLGPRICGGCLRTHRKKDTLYWKVRSGGSDPGKIPLVLEEKLSPEELVTWRRIQGEPESLLREEDC